MAIDPDVTINFASFGNSLMHFGGWIRSSADFPCGIRRKATFGWPQVRLNAGMLINSQRIVDLKLGKQYRAEPRQA